MNKDVALIKNILKPHGCALLAWLDWSDRLLVTIHCHKEYGWK